MSKLEEKYNIDLGVGRSDILEEYFQSDDFEKPKNESRKRKLIWVGRKKSEYKDDKSSLIKISGFKINETALISRKEFCVYVKSYLDSYPDIESEIYVKGIFRSTKSRDAKVEKNLHLGKISIVRSDSTSLSSKSMYFYIPNNLLLGRVYEAIGFAAYKNNNHNKRKTIEDYKEDELGIKESKDESNTYSYASNQVDLGPSLGIGSLRGKSEVDME